MARKIHRLKSTQISAAKPGMHPDGGNLYLQVTDSKAKSWLFRYASNGRERQMGLGSLNDVSLADARDLAAKYRRLLHVEGIDPIEARDRERGERALSSLPTKTFKRAAEEYIETHHVSWKNAKHLDQWKTTMAQHVYPVIGQLPVSSITPAQVLSVLKPIWNRIPVTASRVRNRIELVMDAAKAQGLFKGDNPAAWKGNLKPQLPARNKVRSVEHYAALPYTRIGEFVAKIRTEDSESADALEFVVLCAARVNEVSGMRGREIDLDAKVWTIPADRMKGGLEHKVPLSDRALEIARKRMRGPNDFLFPGFTGKGLSHSALKMCRQRHGYGEFTTHGMRSAFRTWGSEQTSFPKEILEAALAHKVNDAVAAAYNRTTFFDKRRELMKLWADYCDRIHTPDAQVIQLRAV